MGDRRNRGFLFLLVGVKGAGMCSNDWSLVMLEMGFLLLIVDEKGSVTIRYGAMFVLFFEENYGSMAGYLITVYGFVGRSSEVIWVSFVVN